ncbi:homoserine dehydrogenase [Butyricicoccus sp.]|uniref:homoserine dehydrogenase n=1 Tax=Butyricicoccus sp. TaxID=2049021 RepID=UPI003734F668
MFKAAIMGFGTVGSGVYEVLDRNADVVAKNARDAIEVKYILDLRDFPDAPHQEKFIKDFSIIENDPEVSIVAETMGGKGAAYEFTKRCLLAGKHVVTSNKELVATHGAELLGIAKESGVNYMFEASVGGGIPIIRPMLQCLTANHMTHITGILNGTTNYILTRMIDAGLTFETALKEAQEKGYAEANPAADVDGIDACRKICILSDIAYGDHIHPEFVETEGISKITLEDVSYAAQADCVVKLLGRAVLNEDGSIYAFVAPHLVSKKSPLADVDDVFNAILITGDMLGDAMFYGQGAGKLATASAVVADIIDCARHNEHRRMVSWGDGSKNLVRPLDGFASRWYVRLEGTDAAKRLIDAFPGCDMLKAEKTGEEAACITAECTTAEMKEKAAALGSVIGCMRLL